jgi:L-ascorbate metabolism protein UlaG (beta-lactamase superfamily)
MLITNYGHSCFQIEINGTKILFDPFIRPNEKASSIDISKIHPDIVAISHGHNDHIADAEEIISQSGASFFCNWEIYNWLTNKGLKGGHPMNTGGSKTCDWGKISLTPAIHSSSLPDGSYGGSANGICIEIGVNSIYFAGDTDLFSDMQLIARKRKPSIAFLPIGDNFTMDAESAVEAAKLLNVKRVIGMHYDTFPYIVIDHQKSIELFKDAGLELTLMTIGETISI